MKKPNIKIKDSAEGKGRIRFIGSWKGKIVSDSGWIPNMMMKSLGYGVSNIAAALLGDAVIEVTHAKIGTGSVAVVETNTDLAAPVNIGGGSNPSILRGDKELVSVNIARLSFFISDADLPNGTYTRWGLFTGTYAVDEKMMAQAVVTPSYTKATNQDTTVVHEVTINN